MLLITQLHNYRYSHNITNKGDVRNIPFEVRTPWVTRPFHFTLEIIRMITTHHVVNHARFATFRSTKSMLVLKNKALPNTIIPQHNGITFHGGMINIVLQFFTIVNDGVQGVLVMATYPNKYVPMITTRYLVFVKNDEFF